MKKIVLSLLLAASAMSAFAQGTVNFGNGVAFTTATDQSRLVYDTLIQPGRELVGTQFRAQLYYGSSAATLQAVATTGNAFRAAGTTTPGTWSGGGSRTLNGFVTGDTVQLQVRAWDSTTGNSWDTATTRGASALFSYVVPASGSLASAFYMENLRAFAVVVPEPGTFALAGLGILGFVMMRRRKK